MRLLIVLCASLCFGGSFARAQEPVTDAQRLNAAPFAAKPFPDSPRGLSIPDTSSVTRFGKVAVVTTYSLERTAESWRVPESGQSMTNQEAQLKGYLADHPLLQIGVRAFTRSGRHSDISDSRDPSSLAVRHGHERSEKKVMIDLIQLFGSKK